MHAAHCTLHKLTQRSPVPCVPPAAPPLIKTIKSEGSQITVLFAPPPVPVKGYELSCTPVESVVQSMDGAEPLKGEPCH